MLFIIMELARMNTFHYCKCFEDQECKQCGCCNHIINLSPYQQSPYPSPSPNSKLNKQQTSGKISVPTVSPCIIEDFRKGLEDLNEHYFDLSYQEFCEDPHIQMLVNKITYVFIDSDFANMNDNVEIFYIHHKSGINEKILELFKMVLKNEDKEGALQERSWQELLFASISLVMKFFAESPESFSYWTYEILTHHISPMIKLRDIKNSEIAILTSKLFFNKFKLFDPNPYLLIRMT